MLAHVLAEPLPDCLVLWTQVAPMMTSAALNAVVKKESDITK